MKNPVIVLGMRFSLRILLLLIMLSSWVSPLQVVQAQGISFPAEINKEFSPISITVGQVSRLNITIYNPNFFQLTNAAWADNLTSIQPGLFIATPVNLTQTCPGTVIAPAGGTSLSLSGGIVPPQIGVTPGVCTVSINVTSTTPGNLINTIPAGGLTGTGGGGTITNTTPASATLQVRTALPPLISKLFAPNTMWIGQVSRLTIAVSNLNPNIALTQTTFTDTLPTGVVLANPVDIILNSCGATASLSAVSGSGSLTLNNATINPGDVCLIMVNVTSTVAGAYTNTIPPGAIHTTQGVTNQSPATAPLNVQGIGLLKSFSPPTVEAGGITILTITVQNPTGTPFTGVNFSDTLPGTVLTVVSGSAATTCGGTASTTLPRTVSLTGGIIPAGNTTTPGTCTITVQVTSPPGAVTNTFTNTIPAGALTSNQGIVNVLPATAPISIYTTGEGVGAAKSFAPPIIEQGQNARLLITVTAPPDSNLTNFALIDNLPTSVTVSNSSPATRSAGCGPLAVLTADTGATSVTLTNGTILAGTTCQISVYVTSNVPGYHTNVINPGDISNDQEQTLPDPISADLEVQAVSDLADSKLFTPDIVGPNGVSLLTISLTNTNNSPLINVSLTDNLPGNSINGIVVAPVPNASTTCGSGVVSAVSGTQTVSMTGGTIPAQAGAVPGLCTITVNVQGKGVTDTYLNIIPPFNVSGTIQGTSTVIRPVVDATAPLTITDLSIGIVKEFIPLTVFGGSASTMSVELVNPNNTDLIGISFTDNMPAGMIVADPASPAVGTCGGTITATPGYGSFLFSGGSLPPFGTCTLTVSITMTVNGNLTNVIPAGRVTTLNGASNPQPTDASLTNLPGASISKSFSPNPINVGDYSLLTITIQNTGNIPLTDMGLIDTLPAGLSIADVPDLAPVNNCGGTLSAAADSEFIQLTNGTLAASSACTMVVAVTGSTTGSYQNIIPAGNLTSNEGATNNTPATDTLMVLSGPATASLGNYVWIDTNANGIQDATETGIDGVLVNLYSSTGVLIATTTTAGGGLYLFDNLDPGNYYVEFVPPAGYTISPQAQGGNDATDSDANPANGQTIATILIAGENDLTWDAGLYQTASLGNYVWNDVNANGLQDGGAESGIDGVTVNLYRPGYGPDGIPGNADDGDIVATTTTAGGGLYLFDDLVPGNYYVDFMPPVGYMISPQNQGGNDAIDSDANATTGETTTTTLVSGQHGITWDAGLYQQQSPNGLTKTITGTSLPSTTGTNVAIGEIVTYQINVTIPPGTYTTATLVDTMERGLAFVTCDSIDAPGLTTDVAGSFTSICATPTTSDAGGGTTVDVDRRVTYSFGTLTNASQTDAILTITYRAIVLDSAANIDGNTLNNNASWSWSGGSIGSTQTNITIVEPELVIDKTADITFIAVGTEAIFTLTIRHTQNSQTDAHDVVMEDALPATLDFVSGSLNCTSGDQDPIAAECFYNPVTRTIHAEWATFTLGGGVGQIRFRVTGNASLPANTSVTNVGTVAWTSMPGDLTTPQSFTPNSFATERFYDPGNPVNFYGDDDALILTPLGSPPEDDPPKPPKPPKPPALVPAPITSGFIIPVTGFTPNTSTALNSVNRTDYGSTSIAIEIPALKVATSIVGVKLQNGNWDVAWLQNQIGWLNGTAYPTWDGNSVLTGHVVNADGKPGVFAKLKYLKAGEYVFVYNSGYRYIYKVVSNKSVHANDISILKHEEQAYITLVTCDNYDKQSSTFLHRIVVRAVLVDVQSEK